jgi:hypothetical protein
MLGKVKVCALDQLLLERYCGKVSRGLAVELSPRRDSSRRVESLFTLVVECQLLISAQTPKPRILAALCNRG